MKKCDLCKGEGVQSKGGKLIECQCAQWRRIAALIPTYIRLTRLSDAHFKSPIIEMVNKSIFLISRWPDSRAIIKIAMIKNHDKLFRLTSDRELRDVFVGNLSKSSKSEEDEGPIYNSIKDFVDLPDLVIIRLNELKYKNKAAPGILEEALSYRADRLKPTWLLSDPMDPFGASSVSYSPTVWDFINTVFERHEVKEIARSFDQEQDTTQEIMESKTESKIEPKVVKKVQRPDMSSHKDLDDLDLAGVGSFGGGSKKKGKKY